MTHRKWSFPTLHASRQIRRLILPVACLVLLTGCSFALYRNALELNSVSIPGGTDGVTFGDLQYDSRLGRVIVPSPDLGTLTLIQPDTLNAQVIEGFGGGGDNTVAGVISATVARGMIFAVDTTGLKMHVIDEVSRAVIGSTPLAARPEYVRFVPATNELWVTQPELEQIEIFTVPTDDPFTPESVGVIPVEKGPEGLVIDRSRGFAYTNQPEIGVTMIIQVQTRGVLDQWGNGCSEARGLALDEERGYLFVACGEGKVVMMDSANDGNQIASQTYGGGINAIAYNPRLQHIYLPSGASAILAVFGIRRVDTASGTASSNSELPEEAANATESSQNPSGEITLVRLGTMDTALNAVCVAADDTDGIWVCDPTKGQLLLAHDTFPASDDEP